ncbi:MAG: amidohydrolase family protein [Verrucomicrobiota bacterium]
MHSRRIGPARLLFWLLALVGCATPARGAGRETPPPWPGDAWRQAHRVIDLHLHVQSATGQVARAASILQRAGVGLGVNLSGGTVTTQTGEVSEFERMRDLAERIAPGRFLHYFNLNYAGWEEPDFAARAVAQVERAHALGAAGLKEFKRLGLFLRDGQGRLIRIDDPKLDGVWRRCGELGLPVSIHVADPRAFWRPYAADNERWKELRDHRNWWFGDAAKYPPREDLLAALDRVIARHPRTTFVAVHFANNAEDLDWVDARLSERPNMHADLAARMPELGRHDPARVRALFEKHQDRILFGTDFQVYDRLILGSSGDGERPTDEQAAEFYRKEWRWLETNDRDWPHMTPIQGDWNIHSIGLPPAVLRKVYFDNARRLLVRSVPPAVVAARRVGRDFRPDGRLGEPEWSGAPVFPLEQEARDGRVRPGLSTACRLLWSDRFLYLGFECPYTALSDHGRPQAAERITSGSALWDRDVVEFFCAPDPAKLTHYTEYEWAPNNEALDLRIRRPEFDFAWNSKMEWKVRVDRPRRVWTCEARIPLAALHDRAPLPGTRWRANLYRIDRAGGAFLASNPLLSGSFHTPERFGWLEFLP